MLLACPNNPLLSPSTRQAACKEYYRPIVGLGEVELAINKGRTNAGVDYKELLEGMCVNNFPLRNHSVIDVDLDFNRRL